jgi:glycosyltransferase involved in cell wall biosynthesis
MTGPHHPDRPQIGSEPTVTLLVAMRNEEQAIEATLHSILAQDYPSERLEIRVYDGDSTDRSWALVEEIARVHPNVHLARNPRVTQAAGWNLGIDHASSDIVGIVSAHCELAPDYVSTAVETLRRTGADMVGGLMRAAGEGRVGEAVALATSTPFGVGGARFHYTDREEEVDTVYMGLCRREVYQRFRFDEEMVRDQDDELSYRLLDAGGRIVCNPAIRSSYRNRSTFPGLWRQYFQYGFWKVRVMQKHPAQIRLRQLVPPAFVASILVAAVLSLRLRIGRLLLGTAVGSYLAANLAASAHVGRRSPRIAALLPPTFAVLHIAYGLGFLAGLTRFRSGWRDAVVGQRGGPEPGTRASGG